MHLIIHVEISNSLVLPEHRLNGRLLALQKTQKVIWTPHGTALSLLLIGFGAQ